MCGIFAYHGCRPPDPDLLEQAAVLAGKRGPHGHGWTVAERDAGRLVTVHRAGPVTASLPDIRAVRALTVIGHARLATFGDYRDVSQMQPVETAGHAVAHNGNIYNAAELGGAGATDTISFARAYASLRMTLEPEAALTRLMAQASQQAWAIVVADADGWLYAHRSYHPLYVHDAGTGRYLCSRPLSPGDVPVPEGRVLTC